MTRPPELAVRVDGVPLPPSLARALSEARVRQELSLPSMAELMFVGDHAAAPAPGATLELAVAGHDEPLFAGEVTAVERAYGASRQRETIVRAYDPLHRLRKRQPVRAHTDVSVAGLARTLVADLGLRVSAAENGPTWQRLVQYRESDFDLLARMTERCGLYFTLRGATLHLVTLDGSGEPIALSLGRTLHEARVEVNADAACRTVSATGWDPLRAEHHRAARSQARVGRRVGAQAPPGRVGGTGERTIVDDVVQTDDQAAAVAQAELDARTAGEVTLWAAARGDPRLRPGAIVETHGLDETLSGRYVVGSTTHLLDGTRGYVTEFDTAPPLPRARAGATSVALAVVSRVDDPDNLGRVQVSLPSYANIETDWLGVLTAAAGPEKGIVALPDVGDLVLLLLPRGDPAQAIVLGGLYGARGAPDSGVEGGAVKRYTFRTPGGQIVRLDDTKQLVRIETSGGSFAELSPEMFRLHAASDLTLEAPGRTVTIRGSAVNFEKA